MVISCLQGHYESLMNPNSQRPNKSVLAALFSNDVVTEEIYVDEIHYNILPEEEALIKNAVPKRRNEFRAGRYCARKALQQMNVSSSPILIGRGREPIWPIDIVGSISHSNGYCCVALTNKRYALSLGLDVELIRVVDRNVWNLICTQKELLWSLSLPFDEQNKYLHLIFSAKESVYKCQFQVSKQWMNFHDVEISLKNGSDSFEAVIRSDVSTVFPQGYSFTGNYSFANRYVFTGVTLRNSDFEE